MALGPGACDQQHDLAWCRVVDLDVCVNSYDCGVLRIMTGRANAGARFRRGKFRRCASRKTELLAVGLWRLMSPEYPRKLTGR
jgi:hypothetical protein